MIKEMYRNEIEIKPRVHESNELFYRLCLIKFLVLYVKKETELSSLDKYYFNSR